MAALRRPPEVVVSGRDRLEGVRVGAPHDLLRLWQVDRVRESHKGLAGRPMDRQIVSPDLSGLMRTSVRLGRPRELPRSRITGDDVSSEANAEQPLSDLRHAVIGG